MNTLSTSVVICGAGPVGLTLAHLLALDGIDCVLIEKLDATMTEPRAIVLDGESLRTLQKVGVLDGFRDQLLEGVVADYVNGEGKILFTAGRSDFRPYGYEMTSSFDQPSLDRYLAEQLTTGDNSAQLLFRHTLVGFEQDDSGVTVSCRDASDEPLTIHCVYLVGCDGGRSTVRSQLGIGMSGESNPQPWLVIDTVDPHLVDEVECRFFCDPRRPGMTIRKRNGERRWEWMLMPGEDRDALLRDEAITALIAPYTDVEQVNVYRKKVYDFHALIAERWREGRVFLAGDAAHMTPPFAGQGLNSGLRDVSNLAWKLALVVKGQAGEGILASYEKDRKEHARQLIEIATNLGDQIQPIDPGLAAERDAFFEALSQDPAAMEELEQGLFASLTERYADASLCVSGDDDSVSTRLLIQPELGAQAGPVLLDEALGGGFAIVGFNYDPRDALAADVAERWQALGARLVRVDSGTAAGETVDTAIWTLVDREGEFAEWLGGDEPALLLVRPDRFCMVHAQPDNASARFRKACELLEHPA